MVGNFYGERRKQGIIRKVWHLNFENRNDDLFEGRLKPRFRVHSVGVIRGVVVASELKHSFAFVGIETDRALIDVLHFGKVYVEHLTQVERIGELVTLDFASNIYESAKVPLLQALQLRVV